MSGLGISASRSGPTAGATVRPLPLLRPIAEAPAVWAELAAMLADRQLRGDLYGGCTRTSAECACRHWLDAAQPGRWAAVDPERLEVLGALALQHGELSYFVSPLRRGRGHGLAMLQALLAQPANARQPLFARVLRENLASRRLLHAAGFVEAGIETRHGSGPCRVLYRRRPESAAEWRQGAWHGTS